MSRRQSRLLLSMILGGLLLGSLFIPGAQRAIDVVISPLRNLTYPQPTDRQFSEINQTSSNTQDELRVVSYGVNPARRQIIVDIGEQTVVAGEAVTVEGVLVGVVDVVEATTARVTLVNDPSFRVIAQTDRGARGLVLAEYQQLTLGDVADDQLLLVGDEVRTLNDQYQNAASILVGVVDEVVDSEGLLRSAILRQPLELNNLSKVSIP